jgi:4-azaleucine resistance transporter AzlC
VRRLSPQRAALAEGWPVLLSVVVVGIPFGIVARQSGLSPAEIVAMSVFVFAGASQFAMVQLFKDGVPWPVIVATVFLINLRHLLMAAALRPYFARVSVARRLAAAYVLTDEAFAMAIGWFRRGRTEVAYYAAFAVALYILWNVATLIGLLLGPSIGEPRRFGVDFAITATFIAIVVLGVRRRSDAVVALGAALLASALTYAGASVVAVVTAGALAPLLVVFAPDEDPA